MADLVVVGVKIGEVISIAIWRRYLFSFKNFLRIIRSLDSWFFIWIDHRYSPNSKIIFIIFNILGLLSSCSVYFPQPPLRFATGAAYWAQWPKLWVAHNVWIWLGPVASFKHIQRPGLFFIFFNSDMSWHNKLIELDDLIS